MKVRCHYCDAELDTRKREVTIDHVVLRGRGGLDIRWNIVPACRTCNGLKGDKWPTCDCSFCRRTQRRHWERFGIRESTRSQGWVKVERYRYEFMTLSGKRPRIPSR